MSLRHHVLYWTTLSACLILTSTSASHAEAKPLAKAAKKRSVRAPAAPTATPRPVDKSLASKVCSDDRGQVTAKASPDTLCQALFKSSCANVLRSPRGKAFKTPKVCSIFGATGSQEKPTVLKAGKVAVAILCPVNEDVSVLMLKSRQGEFVPVKATCSDFDQLWITGDDLEGVIASSAAVCLKARYSEMIDTAYGPDFNESSYLDCFQRPASLGNSSTLAERHILLVSEGQTRQQIDSCINGDGTEVDCPQSSDAGQTSPSKLAFSKSSEGRVLCVKGEVRGRRRYDAAYQFGAGDIKRLEPTPKECR